MRGVQAPCPACGAPVRFKISSSLVTICEHCNSVVARRDRKLEDHGKVAAIVETNSPLQLGLRGKFRDKSFELVGRAQYAHAAGGSWDEWYAAFSNGKWGWIAEAQGRFYLTFERKLSEGESLPALEELTAGERLNLGKLGEFTVGEVGEAKTRAAAGEIPYQFVPNAAHPFADLYGENSRFATLDYSGDEPKIYAGREVSLRDIGIAETVLAPEQQPREISAIQVACPNCAGPLVLHAPDQTQRVCCPSCGSLLDADRGNLKFLKTLDLGTSKPLIPIGASGRMFDVEYTVIGMLRRSVTEEGQDYFWSEYLLYNPREGFRWLVANDGHWSFVRPVSPGEVRVGPMSADYAGKSYRIFQQGIATVRQVLGECYWKVEVGEQAATFDYVAPPEMLSVERSAATATVAREQRGPRESSVSIEAGELNISLGVYVRREMVEEAFGVPELPSSWKIAPNQPFPVEGRIYVWWAGFAAVLFLLDLLLSNGFRKESVDQFYFFLSLVIMSLIPVGALIYRYHFESSRWADSPYSTYGSWGSDDE